MDFGIAMFSIGISKKSEFILLPLDLEERLETESLVFAPVEINCREYILVRAGLLAQAGNGIPSFVKASLVSLLANSHF